MADNTEIPEGWVETSLGEITTFSQGLQVPSEKQELVKKDGYVRFVRIVDYTNDGEIPRYIQNPGGERYLVNLDDLVMIRYGSQTAGKIVRGVEGIIANNTFKIVPRIKLDKNWLFWFLNQESIYQMLNKDQSSSTMPAINFSQVSRISIFLPPLREQQAIGRMLSSFDDKIELLGEQNETLEKTAQTIFQEWFGKDGVEDELPEGWKVGKLGEITSLKSGFPFSGEDFIDNSDVKVLKIKDLKGGGIVDLSDVSCVKNEVKEQERVMLFKLSAGDVVLAMSGNTTGKIGVVPENNGSLYLNQRVGKFFLKNREYTSFLYFFLMSGNYEEKILNMGYGSAQPNINPSQIENIDVIFPEETLLKDYIFISDGAFNKILQNHFQIQTLSKIRDELLPRLMSGEVRVEV